MIDIWIDNVKGEDAFCYAADTIQRYLYKILKGHPCGKIWQDDFIYPIMNYGYVANKKQTPYNQYQKWIVEICKNSLSKCKHTFWLKNEMKQLFKILRNAGHIHRDEELNLLDDEDDEIKQVSVPSDNRIPRQLHQQRFVRLGMSNYAKNPFDVQWQISNNFDHEDILKWLDVGGNYGVLGGVNGLVVLDFDNKDFFYEKIADLPETFAVMSPSKKGIHCYYYVDGGYDSRKIIDVKGSTLCDIQSFRKQVVGPGSKYPKGGIYKVVVDKPIANITSRHLNKVFKEYQDIGSEWFEQFDKISYTNNKYDFHLPNVLSYEDVLEKAGITKFYGRKGDILSMCPVGHESKGGKCFCFNNLKDVYYCFHCEAKGKIIGLYQKLMKVSFEDAYNAVKGVSQDE